MRFCSGMSAASDEENTIVQYQHADLHFVEVLLPRAVHHFRHAVLLPQGPHKECICMKNNCTCSLVYTISRASSSDLGTPISRLPFETLANYAILKSRMISCTTKWVRVCVCVSNRLYTVYSVCKEVRNYYEHCCCNTMIAASGCMFSLNRNHGNTRKRRNFKTEISARSI